MPMDLQQRLEEARKNVTELSADEARSVVDEAVLLDVREPDEWQRGRIPGATHLPMMRLLEIDSVVPNKDARVIVYCSHGIRSLLAADALKRQGYKNAASILGGLAAWAEQGHPVDL